MRQAFLAATILLAGSVMLAHSPAAAEQATLPVGALTCTIIEPAIEHARLARMGASPRLDSFTQEQIESGTCRFIDRKAEVHVVDVDERGFALVEDSEFQWWTAAENVWGPFGAAARLAEWKKR